MAQTVTQFNNVFIQEINPYTFGIYECKCGKRNTGIANYFNLNYFTVLGDGTFYSCGNLAHDGIIVQESKNIANWVDVSRKQLSTMCVYENNTVDIIKTDTLSNKNIKTAVNGIPITKDGQAVTLTDVKAEGYDGSQLYNTWHGFLGIRNGKIVYVAAKIGTLTNMVNLMLALGIKDSIKVDGGGSFILSDHAKVLASTEGNRKIHAIGMWE